MAAAMAVYLDPAFIRDSRLLAMRARFVEWMWRWWCWQHQRLRARAALERWPDEDVANCRAQIRAGAEDLIEEFQVAAVEVQEALDDGACAPLEALSVQLANRDYRLRMDAQGGDEDSELLASFEEELFAGHPDSPPRARRLAHADRRCQRRKRGRADT